MSIGLSNITTTTPATPAASAPRPGYLELKGNVHRKLLNRLNLEALASADRARSPRASSISS